MLPSHHRLVLPASCAELAKWALNPPRLPTIYNLGPKGDTMTTSTPPKQPAAKPAAKPGASATTPATSADLAAAAAAAAAAHEWWLARSLENGLRDEVKQTDREAHAPAYVFEPERYELLQLRMLLDRDLCHVVGVALNLARNPNFKLPPALRKLPIRARQAKYELDLAPLGGTERVRGIFHDALLCLESVAGRKEVLVALQNEEGFREHAGGSNPRRLAFLLSPLTSPLFEPRHHRQRIPRRCDASCSFCGVKAKTAASSCAIRSTTPSPSSWPMRPCCALRWSMLCSCYSCSLPRAASQWSPREARRRWRLSASRRC